MFRNIIKRTDKEKANVKICGMDSRKLLFCQVLFACISRFHHHGSSRNKYFNLIYNSIPWPQHFVPVFSVWEDQFNYAFTFLQSWLCDQYGQATIVYSNVINSTNSYVRQNLHDMDLTGGSSQNSIPIKIVRCHYCCLCIGTINLMGRILSH